MKYKSIKREANNIKYIDEKNKKRYALNVSYAPIL